MSAASRPPDAPVPARPTLPKLRRAVQGCRACELWRGTTQAVLGEGPARAPLMLVGEAPGDREDIEGHPFVGPAGGVLDRGLERAGIDRSAVYLTNVVKHFRYKARGKRRIHQRPDRAQVSACRPWLDAELRVVRPKVLVCLGATAAQALLGPQVRIGRDRGKPMPSELAELVMLTTHPSAIMRARDQDARTTGMDEFVRDLTRAARWLGIQSRAPSDW
jgi:uracil-DNA glycosylase family protein